MPVCVSADFVPLGRGIGGSTVAMLLILFDSVPGNVGVARKGLEERAINVDFGGKRANQF